MSHTPAPISSTRKPPTLLSLPPELLDHICDYAYAPEGPERAIRCPFTWRHRELRSKWETPDHAVRAFPGAHVSHFFVSKAFFSAATAAYVRTRTFQDVSSLVLKGFIAANLTTMRIYSRMSIFMPSGVDFPKLKKLHLEIEPSDFQDMVPKLAWEDRFGDEEIKATGLFRRVSNLETIEELTVSAGRERVPRGQATWDANLQKFKDLMLLHLQNRQREVAEDFPHKDHAGPVRLYDGSAVYRDSPTQAVKSGDHYEDPFCTDSTPPRYIPSTLFERPAFLDVARDVQAGFGLPAPPILGTTFRTPCSIKFTVDDESDEEEPVAKDLGMRKELGLLVDKQPGKEIKEQTHGWRCMQKMSARSEASNEQFRQLLLTYPDRLIDFFRGKMAAKSKEDMWVAKRKPPTEIPDSIEELLEMYVDDSVGLAAQILKMKREHGEALNELEKLETKEPEGPAVSLMEQEEDGTWTATTRQVKMARINGEVYVRKSDVGWKTLSSKELSSLALLAVLRLTLASFLVWAVWIVLWRTGARCGARN